ncbi:2-phospho-L-lactate transferase [Longispora fulva]|uniref:LPPG:FO 2-phospho-L-lactate transferase n=1 Tax=Longispora fulva TaxID=619741 RepID=A0A8J7GY90_9ACTN|nr:2-phospho-L-lactate transferase [Longispora fulva]MBG6140371.1 LPPG:FO 2-phospho-L-lactate transferase [Longispora fulva]GIG57248.1 2-phospho-L-lactate transferase [Longispora fulva]
MRIAVLAGGIGGARFLLGVRAWARAHDAEVTAIVNVGDDVTLHGLRICPDLDSIMYTLGGGSDTERGWGRAGESWTVKEELAKYGAEPTWFGLGDKDIATHLVRTRQLSAGLPLSQITRNLCERWQPGITMLPATDNKLETHAVTDQGAVHFQEWWIRYRADIPTETFVFLGAAESRPAPGVLEALDSADVILVAPSNPVVSIAPILAVPGLRAALVGRKVVGVSPIIGDAPVRGMADKCLAVLGVPVTAGAVGAMYADFLTAWLVDSDDTAEIEGVEVVRTPLWMTDEAATVAMVEAALAC